MFFISKDAPQLNGEIKDKELRVISETGEQLGIMSAKDAQKLADAKGVDLVKIAPRLSRPLLKLWIIPSSAMSRQSVKKKTAKSKK